ncbi:MAG: hypothetical protein V3W02_05795 [Gammaproteobacteria bacterium]
MNPRPGSVGGNVFMPLTPYHVFLSCGVALGEHRDERNHLILIEDFPGADILVESIKQWSHCPFQSVVLYSGTFGRSTDLTRGLAIRRNSKRLLDVVADACIDALYVFNDARADEQAVIRHVARRRPAARIVCLEDGLAMYASTLLSRRDSNLKRLGKRFLYGRDFHLPDAIGSSPWVHEARLAYVSLARRELAGKCLKPLPFDVFSGTEMRALADEYCERMWVDAGNTDRIEVLVLLPHPELSEHDDETEKLYRSICVEAVRRNRSVALKQHPRDRYGVLFTDDRLVLVPRGLAAEFLFLSRRDEIRFVFGDLSSALMSARWLLPSAKTVSVARLLACVDPALPSVFDRIGVVVPSLEDEIWNLLQSAG